MAFLQRPSKTLPRTSFTTGPFKPTADDEACGKLWKVYIEQAKEYEESLLKEWKADMEALLFFSALYSATLTAFIIESYKTLQEDQAQTTIDLLSRISQQLDGVTSFASPPPFKPTTSALVCNIMWFLSLALALACSLLATFIQQWTRDFIHKTALKPSPVRKARVIAFLYLGMRRFGMQTFVDVIPILLHISLFLFFGGLVGFLLPVNRPLTFVIVTVLVLLFTTYTVLTLLPLFYLDSPYRTPFSGILWRFGTAFKSLVTRRSHQEQSLVDAILEVSVQQTARRDKHAIVHTIKSLTDDNELFPFIEAIPDALYDPGQTHKVRPDNVVLLTPFLLSIDPELNILIRIAQFVSKSSYWSDNVRAQYSLTCTRALWTLAWNYVDIHPVRPWNIDHLRQFVSGMLSFLKSVNSSPLAHDIWSALAAICSVWMHTMSDSKQTSSHLFIYRDLVKAISHEADSLPMIDTSFSRDMLAKIIRRQRAYTVKRIAVLDSLKPSETWHVIQLLCLHRYLVDSQKLFTSLKTLPGDFEWMCDTIYPYSKAPLEVKDNSENIPCLLYTGDFLLALEQYIDETGVLNDSTDTLMRQHLRLFLSTNTPLCSRDEARQCRQFVLRYLHMRYEDCPLHGIWEKFDVGDLKRVGQCILEHIQDPLNNTEQSSVCLKVAFIFVSSDAYTLRVFRRTGDFFPKLFICLHNGPLNTTFKEADGYMLFKTLLDLVVCPRLVPPGDLYEPLPLENLEQTRAKLVQEYLLPYFLSLNTLNSLSYQYTLTIAIASRYINLSCKSKVPSHCIGALNKLGLPGTWQDVHEKVQEIFAESITNLMNTKINENTVPESVKLTLLDAMAFLPSRPGDAPWKWVTSRRSAEILLRAISQNPGLQNVQILEMYRDLEEEGERGTKRLLKHCRQLISMAELGENVIDRNSSES